MATLVAEAEVNRAHLESSAAILGQQQQLEEAARKQVSHCFMCVVMLSLAVSADLCCRHIWTSRVSVAHHHLTCRRDDFALLTSEVCLQLSSTLE